MVEASSITIILYANFLLHVKEIEKINLKIVQFHYWYDQLDQALVQELLPRM